MSNFSGPPDLRQPEQGRRVHPTDAFIEFKKEEIEQSIPQRFEQQVRRYPDRLAVKTKSHQLTYSALNRAADRVARAVLTHAREGGKPVALLLEHDAPMIAAILGVLKTGNIYVPLDPLFPPSRNIRILEDSQADLIITSKKNLSLASSLSRHVHSVINIDEISATLFDKDVDLSISADNLAYILYTSGSTGQPKGVVQNHRNVLHVVMRCTNGLHISVDDRLSLLPSYSVTTSVSNIFGALLNGASLFPYNVKEEGVTKLADWLIKEEITIYRSVPTVFRHFVNTLTGQEKFPKLRLIRVSGEPIYTKDVQLYKEHFSSDSIFVNGYGASEVSNAWQYCIDKNTEITTAMVPVGYPLEDIEVLVLNDADEAVGFNHVGEIAIKSRYISPGYWRRPDLTREAFITDSQDNGEQIYRTGDLGYMQPDGCMVLTGRNDFQVKIRGFRVEVAEIELALRSLTAIREATVAYEDRRGEKQLVAYIVPQPQQPPTISELRDFLKDKLPDYMVPSTFVMLGALPLTPNGKVDRLALPAPSQAKPELDVNFVLPSNALEEQLAEIWSEVLGVTRVGIHDDFFELGGHSLLATQVVSRVRDAFQLELPLRGVFEGPTIAELAERVEAARRGAQGPPAPPPLLPVSRDGHLPLSFAQQRLWFLDQLQPHSPLYNVSRAVQLSGVLDTRALQRALGAIVARHEVLRTTFTVVDGDPVQIVASASPMTLPLIDLSKLLQAEREAEAQRLATEEAQRPFDLERGPLLQTKLLRLGEQEHVLLLAMHHIVSDGWSMDVFWRELVALYEAFCGGKPSPLAELPIQYADYALWQREWLQGEVLESQLSYWKGKLADVSTLQLPTDRPRPAVPTHRGARRELMLSKPLTEALKKLSKQEGVTLFMTLLAAFQVLLSRYSGQEDIAVGTPIAGRNRAETEGLIGFFINTLVMRADLSGDPTFKELMGRVREVALGAYDHQDVPFEKLVEELKPERDLSRSPLFQAFLNMSKASGTTIELSGLKTQFVTSSEERSKFDLTLYVVERHEDIRLTLVYNADLFEQASMAEMLKQFNCLLAQIVESPQSTIGSYSLVTPQARALLPDPKRAMPEPRYELVTNLFVSWTDRTPQQTAVRQGNKVWSYGELAASAHALARYLRAQGIERGDVVALLGPRSLGLITGMMAVLLSGGAFLTIDRNLPIMRQRVMLQKAGAKHILLIGDRQPGDEWVQEFPSLVVTSVAPDTGRVAEPQGILNSEASSLPEPAPDDPAYIFFTSGTTGTPKGILGSHKGLSHFLDWQRETFAVGPQDRCAQLSSLSFDALLRDVFLPLTSGATLCLPEEDNNLSADQIMPWLEREKISLLHTVPALAQSWLGNLPAGISLRTLRYVFFSGEPLTETLIRHWSEAFPEGGAIINLYGPTETTMVKCFFRVGSHSSISPGIQPVGWPLPQTQALVLSRSGQVCGIGEPGEIVIRTPFRTLGYIGAGSENGGRFVRNPLRDEEDDLLYYTGDRGRYRTDGALEYLGRLDHQVKVRGVRIEPGEIEAMLSQHPAIRTSVVVARDDVASEASLGSKRLVAYVVPNQDRAPSVSELHNFLKERLPEYMVPSAFIIMEALPLTSNGKIDRHALPAPDPSRFQPKNTYTAPRTPVEEALGGIWAEVLGLAQVGIHEDFFELGGHSLLVTQVVSRLRNAFQVEVPLRALFEAPTVAGLAERIEAARRSDPVSSVATLGSEDLDEGRL